MAGLLGGFDPLAGLLGPATNTDPLAQYAGVDPVKARLGALGQFAGGLSDELLYYGPRRAGGDIATIGRAIRAGGAAAKKEGQERLATDLLKKQTLTKIQDEEYARQREKEQDQALTDMVAGLPPEQRKMLEGNPALAKVFGEEWAKSQFGSAPRRPTSLQEYDEAVAQGYKGTWMEYDALRKKAAASGGVDYSTTPRQVWDQSMNDGKGGIREYFMGEDATIKEVPYPEGTQPLEATSIRAGQSKAYEKQQDAASTSVLNLAETSTAIDGIRNELLTDPAWKVSWGGKMLKDLPGTQAQALRDRLNQVNSLAFFSNIGQMQGYGALSNNEGDRVKDAKSRVNQATDLPSLIKALDDLEKVSEEMYARNQRIMSAGTYEEMDKIRKENAAGTKFKKSRVPPFPGDGFGFTQEEWNANSADEKRAFYDAQKLAY